MRTEKERLYYKAWREKNKESIKEYREKNRDKNREYQKKFRENNEGYIKQYNIAEYESSKVSKARYIKERKKLDMNFRIACNLRSRLSFFITGKSQKTLDYIGCSITELRSHIEKQFLEGMTWENYGEWEIDHIFPISLVDLTKNENIHRVMNFSNFQPLWKDDNIRKGNKIKKTFDFE